MDSEEFVDFYELLGLSRSASSKEIEDACPRLGERFRPDNDPTGNPFTARKFALIERAYTTLTNPKARDAYDREYNDRIISRLPPPADVAWPPHKREGILVIIGSIAVAAIATVAATLVVGPTPLGIITILQLATFRLVPYQSDEGFSKSYLIELDATVVLLLCFLIGLYGLLVYLAILPRPSAVWRDLKRRMRV